MALGSGAARGLAHIGILKALTERGVPIDMIAGSSMGALVGACYARSAEIAEFENIILRIDWKRLLRLADPNLALMFKGFIHGQKVKELLRAIIGDVEFSDLKVALAVVATDANTGEEVIIKDGSVIEAVRASISIPAIFTPVKLKNRFLMDGGVVNPVPVSVVRSMGAVFVVACNVIHKPQRKRPPGSANPVRKELSNGAKKQKPPVDIPEAQIKNAALAALSSKIDKLTHENKDKLEYFQKFVKVFKTKVHKGPQRIDPDTPNVFDVIIQAIDAMEYEVAREKIKGADVVITPNTGHIAALEFYRGREAIEEGYKAAKAAKLKM